MPSRSPTLQTTLMLLLLLALPGCAESGGAPVVLPERQNFIAKTEPAGATSIAKAKAAVGKESGEVVLVGQILAGQFDPFHQGKASFVLTELPEGGHAHQGHDHKDCPFCKRRVAKAPKVVVQCNDATGKLIPIDSRKLLGVASGQVIVVRGTGKVDPALDMFVVRAERIFIRPR